MPPAAKPRVYSKPTLAAAAGVTAFTLVLTGAIVGQVSTPPAPPVPEAAPAIPTQIVSEPAAPVIAQAPPLQPAPPVQQQPAPQPVIAAPAQPVQAIQPPRPQPAIGQEQAVQIARSASGGGSVEEVRARTENGLPALEVRFTNDARATIDATTGRVLEARRGDDSSRSGSSASGRSGRG